KQKKRNCSLATLLCFLYFSSVLFFVSSFFRNRNFMSSANDSSTPIPATSSDAGRTSIQAVPPPPETPSTAPTPTKSKRKRLTVEGLQRIVSRLDKLTVGIVLLFRFLFASFAARNSDLWLHVATGRAIAQQHWFLDKDPFTFTAERPCCSRS